MRRVAGPHELSTAEEKQSLWRRFIEWLKRLPAQIKDKLELVDDEITKICGEVIRYTHGIDQEMEN